MPTAAVDWMPESDRKQTRAKLLYISQSMRLLLPELLAVTAMVLLVWLTIWLAVNGEYRTARNAALENSIHLARTFDDNAARMMDSIDQTMLAIRASYADAPDKFDIRDWMRSQHPVDNLEVQVGHIGPDGIVVNSTTPASKGLNISDREHFRAQLDPSHDSMFISKPLLGRGSGLWQIQISRKLLRHDGSFGGIVVVSLGCDALSTFYDHFSTTGAVSLVGTDGIVRAGGPAGDWSVGSDISSRAWFRQLETETHGSIERLPNGGGLMSFERLEHYPLIVTVGFDRGQVRGKVIAARLHWISIGIVASVAVIMLGAFWIQQRRKSIKSEQALKTTLDNVSQGIAMVDANGGIPVLNRRALELLGIQRLEISGSADALRRHLLACYTAAGLKGGLLECGDKLVEVKGHQTPFGGSVLTYTDVTERSRSEARMRQLALHDRLTGLANRELFGTRMTEAAAQATSLGRKYAILAIDLDSFKAINDGLGHDVGDQVLIVAAKRLLGVTRAADTVARVGGDEFMIILHDIDNDEVAVRVAEDLLAALSKPIRLPNETCRVGASCGLAIFPADAHDEAGLIKNADVALYAAKTDGRGQWRRYSNDMRAALQERRWLEAELRVALAQGEITVAFQPQISADRLSVSGFEALARWHHASRGEIPPSAFIPVAEDCGLITELGRTVLRQACAHAVEWQVHCRVAVNLSPIQFRGAGLLDLVSQTLIETGLPPHLLELEVTEGVLIRDEEQALKTLRGLRSLGIQIALDDFGTGYSSLNYLRRFPFDRVKIDKSFVQAQQQDGRARAILNGIMAISHDLGLAVTAEGVESEEQLATLQIQGCTDFQGYLFGVPMPPEQVSDYVSPILHRIPGRGYLPER